MLIILFHHTSSFSELLKLHFLIPAVILKSSDYTGQLTVPLGLLNGEENAKVKTFPVTVQPEISKCSL